LAGAQPIARSSAPNPSEKPGEKTSVLQSLDSSDALALYVNMRIVRRGATAKNNQSHSGEFHHQGVIVESQC